MSALTLSNCKFREDGVNVNSNNKVNGDINHTNLLNTITFYANEEVHSGKKSASPMSSEERKNKDDTDDTSNNKVTPSSHYLSK